MQAGQPVVLKHGKGSTDVTTLDWNVSGGEKGGRRACEEVSEGQAVRQ